MALVSGGFFVSYQLVDNSGKGTKRRFQLQAATMADAITAEGVFRPKYLAASDCALKSYEISEKFEEDALTLPVPGVQKEDQALIDVIIAGHPTKTGTLVVPGPKPGIFQATSGPSADIVDTANAVVIALIGATAAGQQVYISDGENGQLVGSQGHRRHVQNSRG